MEHWRRIVKIRTNNNIPNLWCIYSKERIDIGERYVEVNESYLEEEVIKTYKYIYLDMLVDNYIEETGEDVEIEEE